MWLIALYTGIRGPGQLSWCSDKAMSCMVWASGPCRSKRFFSSPDFSDSLLYILLCDGFWGSSLRVKRPGREAGHPAIPLFPLCAFMTWTGQLDPVAIMTVTERGVGNICWLCKDVMWATFWCRMTA